MSRPVGSVAEQMGGGGAVRAQRREVDGGGARAGASHGASAATMAQTRRTAPPTRAAVRRGRRSGSPGRGGRRCGVARPPRGGLLGRLGDIGTGGGRPGPGSPGGARVARPGGLRPARARRPPSMRSVYPGPQPTGAVAPGTSRDPVRRRAPGRRGPRPRRPALRPTPRATIPARRARSLDDPFPWKGRAGRCESSASGVPPPRPAPARRSTARVRPAARRAPGRTRRATG